MARSRERAATPTARATSRRERTKSVTCDAEARSKKKLIGMGGVAVDYLAEVLKYPEVRHAGRRSLRRKPGWGFRGGGN